MNADDVQLGPRRSRVGQRAGAVRQFLRRGVLGRVAPDQLPEPGTQAQPVEHVHGAPRQKDTFAEIHRLGITAPVPGVDADGHRQAVDARRPLDGERHQARGLQTRYLLGELAPQCRLETGIVPRPFASHEGQDPGLPHAFAVIS